MVSKNFSYTASNSTYKDIVLELKINNPNPSLIGVNSSTNPYVKMQPSTVQVVNGTSPTFVEFITSADENTGLLQGGILLKANEQITLDFNMGIYKLMAKTQTGSSTLNINAMYYIKVEERI